MSIKNKIKREPDKTYIYLIRHAHFIIPKEKHNYNPHLQLSKKGRNQAKKLAKKLLPLKDSLDLFVCSSMKRASETANIISKQIKIKPHESEDFWEFNKIFWSKKYYHYNYWKHWKKYKNSMHAFNRLLKENKGKIILLVAHGNLIKGILKNKKAISKKEILSLDYKNCNTTLLKFNNKKLEKVYYINSNRPKLVFY